MRYVAEFTAYPRGSKRASEKMIQYLKDFIQNRCGGSQIVVCELSKDTKEEEVAYIPLAPKKKKKRKPKTS